MKYNKNAVILDAQPLFGELLALMLEKYELFKFVKTFNHKSELIQFLIERGDEEIYVFVDYYLEGDSGLSILSEARRLNRFVKVLFITNASSPYVLKNIQLAKPDAIISKNCSLDAITQALYASSIKSFYMDPYLQDLLDAKEDTDAGYEVLTVRETEILNYFAQGLSVLETAQRTFLSKHTIVSHRRNIMAKTKTNSIGQLLMLAKEKELI